MTPTSINLGSLPWLPLEARAAFPKQPCIYFAIDSQGEVQYIGRSINPKQRWANHHRYSELSDIGGIRIAYLFADVDLLPEIEMALIGHWDPPLNGVGCGGPETIDTGNRVGGIRVLLREMRDARGISQNGLARAMGMSLNAVQHIEYKARAINLDTLDKLCQVLKCQPGDLLRWEPDREEGSPS